MKKRIAFIMVTASVLVATGCGTSNSTEDYSGADNQIVETAEQTDTEGVNTENTIDAEDEVQPWHWRRVSGGTFQELEPPQEGQGARRAANRYLGIPENFMENGATKYKEYLEKYVYSGIAPEQDYGRGTEQLAYFV